MPDLGALPAGRPPGRPSVGSFVVLLRGRPPVPPRAGTLVADPEAEGALRRGSWLASARHGALARPRSTGGRPWGGWLEALDRNRYLR